MFGREDLKTAREIAENSTVCPVAGCTTEVTRMTRGVPGALDGYLSKGGSAEKEFDRYLCEEHGIYVTPTTFIYKDIWDNLLWDDASDRNLLGKVLKSKRMKAQLHHENSEDAVTWNVFRFLERSGLLPRFLTQLRGARVSDPDTMYWTYSRPQGDVWGEVDAAWHEFGERAQRASEPDLIIRSDETVFVVEAKLGASSKPRTKYTSKEKSERVGRYSRGQGYLRRSVEDIMDGGYYQLMRFWVLGCLIADRLHRDFTLVNLVRSGQEEGIEQAFGNCIRESQHRRFLRLTWEEVYEFIANAAPAGRDRDRIIWYFKNKTIRREKAFGVP
jgi:hypothetical protein